MQLQEALQAVKVDPLSLESWLYLLKIRANEMNTKKSIRSVNNFNATFQLALECLPFSYKLWVMYLEVREAQMEKSGRSDDLARALFALYERALEKLPLMPRLWLRYGKLLISCGFFTRGRVVFERSLVQLPITQHNKIWNEGLKPFAMMDDVPIDVGGSLLMRNLKLNNTYHRHLEYIDFLALRNNFPALLKHAITTFIPMYRRELKGNVGFFEALGRCLASGQADISSGVLVELVEWTLENCEEGVVQLARGCCAFFSRKGQLVEARNVLKVVLSKTVDPIIFHEIFLSQMMLNFDVLSFIAVNTVGTDNLLQLFFQAATIEQAIHQVTSELASYFIQLNGVLLKQDPMSVPRWIKQAELIAESCNASERKQQVQRVFEEALFQCRPKPRTSLETNASQASSLAQLIVIFGSFLLNEGDSQGFSVLERGAFSTTFPEITDNIDIYERLIEALILKNASSEQLLKVVSQGLQIVKGNKKFSLISGTSVELWKEPPVWLVALEVIEAISSPQEAAALFSKMRQFGVYCFQSVLQEVGLWLRASSPDEAFRTFETAITYFNDIPQIVARLYQQYIALFVQLFPEKYERIRELFEAATLAVCKLNCSESDKFKLFAAYSCFEEKQGSSQRSCEILHQLVSVMTNGQRRWQAFCLCQEKVLKLLGPVAARDVLAQHLRVLATSLAEKIPERQRCLKCFVETGLKHFSVEKSLQQMTRARSVLQFVAEFVNPNLKESHHILFWKCWEQFEIQSGTAATFQDQQRRKRNIAQIFSGAEVVYEHNEPESHEDEIMK